jgi:hypothetical protein
MTIGLSQNWILTQTRSVAGFGFKLSLGDDFAGAAVYQPRHLFGPPAQTSICQKCQIRLERLVKGKFDVIQMNIRAVGVADERREI